MGAFLKDITFKNYCGFKDLYLNFLEDSHHNPLSLLFAPNGSGKSTVLNAIRILSFPWQFDGREVDLLFRKMTFHPDYNPTYAGFRVIKGMQASATFIVDGEEKKVAIENSDEYIGVTVCELERRAGYSPYALFADVDNPMETNRFQINAVVKDLFPTGLADVEEFDAQTNERVVFHTDFIIHKPNGTKVHFKNMSAGEKKIATLLSTLCSPLNRDNYDIFLIDNFSQHVYWERHQTMVDKLLQYFSDKQFIITDHSGILIQYIQERYPKCAYDLEEILKQ